MTPLKPKLAIPAKHWKIANLLVLLRGIARHSPLALLLVAALLTAFSYGGLVGKYQVFPYRIIADGVKTARATLGIAFSGENKPEDWRWKISFDRRDGQYAGLANVPREAAAASRIAFVSGNQLTDPVLWTGGRFQFLELCPDDGCLAVEYNRQGNVARVWPYRPDELERAARAETGGEFPYELVPGFSFREDVKVHGVSLYSNGDLLAVLAHRAGSAFPHGAGVARINPDGYPVWFRRDYSHHWPHLTDNEVALVPGMQVGDRPVSFTLGKETVGLDCHTGKPYRDAVYIIDGGGRLLRSIDLVKALQESPFASILRKTNDGCDPLHLNFVHEVGDDAGGMPDIEPGDLAVSMRRLDAFAILDGKQGHIKRLVRGTFLGQHSVRHIGAATFVMFDNGTDKGFTPPGVMGPSRLLTIDLATGQENTIFPNDRTPEDLHHFSSKIGKVDVSPDRKRAIISYGLNGIAVEVRLSDGEVLNVFRSLHDVAAVERFPEERHSNAAIFRTLGIDYVERYESGGQQ